MSNGPEWGDDQMVDADGFCRVRPVRRRYAMTYEMIHDEAGGSVVAEFMDKTLADGTANRWNADFGKIIYRVRKKR